MHCGGEAPARMTAIFNPFSEAAWSSKVAAARFPVGEGLVAVLDTHPGPIGTPTAEKPLKEPRWHKDVGLALLSRGLCGL